MVGIDDISISLNIIFLKSKPPLIASTFKVISSLIEMFPMLTIRQPSPNPIVFGIFIGPNVSPNSVVALILPLVLYDDTSKNTL